MAITRLITVPNKLTPWFRSDTFNIVQGTPLTRTLSFDFVPNAEEIFSGPFKVQALYADGSGGFVMREFVFAPNDPDFDVTFDVGANTAGYVYFRVLSPGPLPVGLQLNDSQEFDPVAENEVPNWIPFDPNYEPPEPVPIACELPPDWPENVSISFGESEQSASPIVLDVDGSGTIELAALYGTGSVMWDIDQDDFVEASGWITGGDGLLCIDLNSDGVINDHGELFGGTNGYVTLAAYDTNSSNTITSADSDFGDLLVWIDSNADGYSQSGELHTLSSLGITSISTAYSTVNYAIAGNEIKFQSTFVMNGNTYTSVDAFFAYDGVNTEYVGSYTLDDRVLFLPTLRGYGDLPDLHIAMSMDEDLLDLVEDFATSTMGDIMEAVISPPGGAIQDILFRWAGVDDVNPTSRGAYIDARILEFLEAFMGRDYAQFGTNPNPGGNNPVTFLMDAWEAAYHEFAVRLAYQATGVSNLFEGAAPYDPVADTFGDASGIDASAMADWIEAADTWNGKVNASRFLLEMVDDIIGIGNLSSPDYAAFEDALPFGLTIEAITNTLESTGNISGTSNDDLLIGSANSQSVTGSAENDILIGGGGTDTLSGGAGNDNYVLAAGSGSDTISESTSNGTDTIWLADYMPADVRLWTDNSGRLHIVNRADGSDSAMVTAGTTGVSGTTHETAVGLYVEQIVFDDATTWNLASGLTLEGTSSGENLYGSQYNDQISGLDGNDSLYGNRGNDTLISGTGGDNLYGGAGDDTYTFASGSEADFVYESTGNGSDTIRMSGYASADVRLSTNNAGSLIVTSKAAATDFATILAATTGASGTTNETAIDLYMEQIVFDDTTWSLTGGLSLEGSSSGDNLYGSQYSDQIKGMDGNDSLYGNRGADTLIGGDGGDTLRGGDGDDLLYGGAGADLLYGQSGADTFVFEVASAFLNQDTIADFDAGAGDKIDLHDVLDIAFNPLTMVISQFVDFTNSGGNSIMKVDLDGTGTTHGWANVATLNGVTNLDETTLYNNGNLLAA